ncbi:MAG: hypothetical protein FWD58_04905 [Firmicutes bacterium]|nr:hypothetical protein [Bacillota bacterium]
MVSDQWSVKRRWFCIPNPERTGSGGSPGTATPTGKNVTNPSAIPNS